MARSTANGVDRVGKISVKGTGEKLAPLFDGAQQLISVTSIPWYSRQVYLPGSWRTTWIPSRQAAGKGRVVTSGMTGATLRSA